MIAADHLGHGWSAYQIAEQYPHLRLAEIHSALAYYYDHAEEIQAILSEPLDVEQYGETQRCLAGHRYHSFRTLDDRRIVFEDRRGNLWLNTLRMRCPDLRHSTMLQVNSIYSMGRICEMDTFMVGDWFDWPWYRRWPWYWGWGFGAGATCSLGKFQPVTEAQVDAIESLLDYK